MALLNPDPGPADPGAIVLLSGKTYNAMRDAFRGDLITGEDNQIAIQGGFGAPFTISFASEQICYIIQNGARVKVGIPIRNL